MKVLVIPDVHLKPDMFRRAGELMKQGIDVRKMGGLHGFLTKK